MQIRRILYPTDFSPCSAQALGHAVLLARQFDAELHMLHAIVLHADDHLNPAHHFPDPDEIFRRLDEVAATEMASLLRDHADHGLEIVHVRERGIDPASVILEYATAHDTDLIVMGTHGRRGAGHLLLGSVAERVVRLAECPVLTLRELATPRRVETVERILVPIDFSDHSRVALQHGLELASVWGAELELLHVIEELAYPTFYGGFEGWVPPASIPELQASALEALTELMAEAEAGIDWSVHVEHGRASKEIPRFAEARGVDLIVIASHGLTGLDRMLFGSTTERVIRTAACPVFTLKSFGRSLVG